MHKEIELRRRNEELIRFWSVYILLLMIAFIGLYLISPEPHSLNVGFAIMASLLASFICFCWYMLYHKKTSDLLR